MQPFLTKHQSDKPMIKKLMQLILKPDLLEKCESYLDFRRIDLDDKV